MSLAHVEVGQELETERRNPSGWILFFSLAFLMVLSQLGAYFDRTPNIGVIRARVTEELRAEIGLEALPGSTSTQRHEVLDRAARDLKTYIGGDPESALIYAAIRTENHEPLTHNDISGLRISTDPTYKAAYQIYSGKIKDLPTASSLASQIPKTSFINRLVRAHALEMAGDSSQRKDLASEGSTSLFATAAIVIAAVIGVGLIFAYLIARASGKFEPKGFALGWLSNPDADRVALRAGQIFVAFLGVSLFAGGLFLRALPKDFVELPLYLAVLVVVLLLFRVPVGGKWISLRSIGLTTEKLGEHTIWGVCGAVANLPIILVVQLIGTQLFRGLPAPEHPVTVELTGTGSILVILQLVVVAAVLAPVIEEIMFRGTLFPALSSTLRNPLLGGLITSFTFAAIHPTGIPAWPALAAIGGMSCFLAYQTRSLVPSIVMHGVHNLATLVLVLLTTR